MGDPEHISTILERVMEELDALREEAEGWRRRNLILDSQLERLEVAIGKQQALATIYESVLKRLPDGPWLEEKLAHLLEAVMRGDVQSEVANEGGPGGNLEEVFK